MAKKENTKPTSEKVLVDIEKFVLFHKNRISLLKDFASKKSYGRLIFQISFLGFESLAKLLFLNETSPKARFISLLSIPNNGISKNEAAKLWICWRCSLIHQGLETWNEYGISFLSYPENKLRSSTEYPPESIIVIYENLAQYFDNYFKNQNIKTIELVN